MHIFRNAPVTKAVRTMPEVMKTSALSCSPKTAKRTSLECTLSIQKLKKSVEKDRPSLVARNDGYLFTYDVTSAAEQAQSVSVKFFCFSLPRKNQPV